MILLLIAICIALNSFAQAFLPVPTHIVIVILENHSYSQIIGSSKAPHINGMIDSPNTAFFTQSYAIEHPSQPNYLDLFSGCNQGIINDNFPKKLPFTTANLASQLLDAGKTFISYAEDFPNAGFMGEKSGYYVSRHNPAVYWAGSGINQVPPSALQPFSSFPSDYNLLPTVCFVVPNLMNDMHDGSTANGDKWIFDYLFPYIEWAKTHHSLFILTFDEDNNLHDNHITTIFSGQMVKAAQYSQKINHYSVLRTIEEMYKLPYACNAATAEPITDCWEITDSHPSQQSVDKIEVYSNPVNSMLTIVIPNDSLLDHLKLTLTDVRGLKIKEMFLQSLTSQISLTGISSGIYVYQIQSKGKILKKGKAIVK